MVPNGNEGNPPIRIHRAKAQRDSLIRNRLILERLGCFDEAGLAKLRKGNAPTITKGSYAGEIVTGDHIIPRSVCPELDNKIYNLEMMPLTLNQKESGDGGFGYESDGFYPSHSDFQVNVKGQSRTLTR